MYSGYQSKMKHDEVETHTHTGWGTVRLVCVGQKCSIRKSIRRPKHQWSHCSEVQPGWMRNMKGCQVFRHKNKEIHWRGAVKAEIRTLDVHKHMCREDFCSNRSNPNTLHHLSTTLAPAPCMCGWFWISSTGVTDYKPAIHSYDRTIKLTVLTIVGIVRKKRFC